MMHKSEKLTSDPGTLIEINYFDDLFTSFFKHFIFQHYFQHFKMQILFSLLQILRKVKCLLLHVRHCILFMAQNLRWLHFLINSNINGKF